MDRKNKGFTLIELLVVIGIMAVLAAGVVALINPAEKTRQANDANAQNAIGQVATALQAYAAQQTTGTYPTSTQWSGWSGTNVLVTTGELTAMPSLPTGYTPTYLGGAAAPVTSTGVYVNLQSAKYRQGSCSATGNAYWVWNTALGRACGVCAVPTLATNTCVF